MQPEIVVAILVFVGAVITSVIGSYATVRSENTKAAYAYRKEISESLTKLKDYFGEEVGNQKVQLAVVTTKVDTLWEIYAEDAIRQARTTGMIASKSPLAPTGMWESSLSPELTQQIEADALDLACYFGTPYDVAIEIWNRYKVEILASNGDSSVRVLWGTILVVSINAVRQAEVPTEIC